MPLPKPNDEENDNEFMSRCMDNDTMKKEYPDNKQRIAICINQAKSNTKNILDSVLQILHFNLTCNECVHGSTEEVNLLEAYIPSPEEYIDFGESAEDFIIAKYEYIDPLTREIYYFDRMRDYRKDGRRLIFQGKSNSAEYQGKKVTLNKPFRTPDGPKKFSVYVKNEKNNVVKVNFGDPNMKIKKNIPERRKSFRARHNCDNPGPKWKARYWSCKAW
jgi:hypothetical protein